MEGFVVTMYRPPGPCKGCDHRFVGCHDRCDDYHKWKGGWSADVDALKKKRDEEYDIYYTKWRGNR